MLHSRKTRSVRTESIETDVGCGRYNAPKLPILVETGFSCCDGVCFSSFCGFKLTSTVSYIWRQTGTVMCLGRSICHMSQLNDMANFWCSVIIPGRSRRDIGLRSPDCPLASQNHAAATTCQRSNNIASCLCHVSVVYLASTLQNPLLLPRGRVDVSR
jgi:hypothetical protein